MQYILDLVTDSYPSFSLLLGKNNSELAFSLQNKISNLIYVWSDVLDLGTSHLLKSWVYYYAKDDNYKSIYIDKNNRLDLNNIIDDSKFDYIAIDDIHELNIEEQNLLFYFLNEIKDKSNKFLLVSSMYPPSKLNIREDLKTRLGTFLIYQFLDLSEEEKLSILLKFINLREININRHVLQYIIDKINRDLSYMINFIDELDKYSLRVHKDITIYLVNKFLKEKIL